MCLGCGEKMVADMATPIKDDATKGLPPVYMCKKCSTPKEETPTLKPEDLLRQISGVCHTITKKQNMKAIKKAVDDVQESIKELQLVSYDDASGLVDQVGFGIVVTHLWIDENKIRYIGRVFDSTDVGRAIVKEMDKRGKSPEVRIRWNWVKIPDHPPISSEWKSYTGGIEQAKNAPRLKFKRELVIDSVYIYEPWHKKIRKWFKK